MPIYRVTYFFEGVQGAARYASSMVGWTETWYRNLEGNLESVLTDVETDEYIRLRRRMMPSMYRIAWVRANNVLTPRASKTRAVPNGRGTYSGAPPLLYGIVSPGGGGEAGGAPTDNPAILPGQITCAVLVNFTRLPTGGIDPTAHHRRFLLRGLPADLINGNVINIAASSFQRMRDFLNAIGDHETGGPAVPAAAHTLSGHLLRYLTSPADSKKLISALVVSTNTGTQPRFLDVSAPGLSGLTAGVRVLLNRVGFPRGVNRTWNYLSGGVGGLNMILGTSNFNLSGAWDGNGTARVIAVEHGRVNEYLIVGLRTKKVGRPFNLTRGRRRIL